MIIILALIIALLSLGLAIVLMNVSRSSFKAAKVKRERGQGLNDLLTYATAIDDGIILNKNGSLMASWLYRGEDDASSTEKQREMVAFRINQAISNLGSGWMVHVDAVRVASPSYSDVKDSHFPEVLSQTIDDERRQLFSGLGTLYDAFFVITLTWLPPHLMQRKFIELMFSDDNVKERTKSHHLLTKFKQECTTIESRLSLAFKLERLGCHGKHDDFLRWLQFCVTGLNHPIILPRNPIYLDALIGGQELWTGVVPKIGRHFIQVVAVEGFPLESYPGILTALAEFPLEYRWSSRFIFMDTHEAVAHLEKFRKKWKQKIRGFFDQLFNTNSGVVDEDAVSMVADAAAAIAETNTGWVAQGYYTSVVVLMHEDRLQVEDYARQFAKLINRLGFAARVESINTMEAYLGSLPGHIENVRRPLVNTLNFADLLPTSTIWTGASHAPCPMYPENAPPLMHCITSGNSPFRLNLHVRDLGHTIMFGPTRAGKSTHLAMIAMQFRRYPRARIFAFDKGMSMYPTCLATGGQHYIIGEKIAFAPLANLSKEQNRAWALDWLDTMLALNGLNTTPNQRNEIADALISMHDSGAKTLSEFVLTIQDEPIREALKQYTVDGLMGHLLDAENDNFHLSDFITFEIEQLMNLGDKFALPVLLYLFHRIEQSLDGRPALILLDEAWLMLAHPKFRAKIREWLKTLAKLNCMVLMATQNVSDAANSGILDVIIESTATKIFLANVHAEQKETAAIYSSMGLNERQIEIIANAVPKQDYYYVSEQGCRLYQLALGPLALAFVGATDKDSINQIKALYEQYPDEWVNEWLMTRGAA